MASLVPDDSLTIDEGAVAPWNSLMWSLMTDVCREMGVRTDVPFRDLTEREKDIVYHGPAEKKHIFYHAKNSNQAGELDFTYFNAVYTVENALAKVKDEKGMKRVEKFLKEDVCPDCHGTRLSAAARAPKLRGISLDKACTMTLSELYDWVQGVPDSMPEEMRPMAGSICEAFTGTARRLLDLGLGYLTLDRSAATLSTGERQRMQLARAVRNRTTGVLYVLDEPTTGLHPKDAEALVQVLKRLQALGNTVLVVEHDRTVMEAADWLVDMGPGAGTAGGEVTAQGTLAALKANPHSLTGAWLSGQVQNALPRRHFNAAKADKLELKGAVGRNLKNVNLTIPVGGLTVITGVSGSGKSTLIVDTLLPALKAVVSKDAKAAGAGLPFSELYGAEYFDQVVSVDQAPIGRSTRSNAASYTGAFTPIRELFAETLTARERGYSASRFSFLNHGGRCEACTGEGVVRVPMQFLPDLYVRCDVCGGARYNRETLECRWQGKSIAEVLEMTVDEARDFFASHPQIMRRMDALADVGLGYIRLGQSTADFSGGEAQRLKLAAELSRLSSSRTFYLLDEPTTGLHFADVAKLLAVLRRLTDIGATVVVIEHDMQVAACADWVVDVGPGAGEAGGDITAQGTPSQVARMRKSLTASWLRDALKTLRS